MKKHVQIGASLMCTDLGNAKNEIIELEEAGIDFFHVDIMDGNFVPNFALSPDFVKLTRNLVKTPIDVHLMVSNPEKYIDVFVDSGADMISIHPESTNFLLTTLLKIKEKGLKVGISINPETSLKVLDYVWEHLDYLNIMTVNPGFAGQKFIDNMYRKISDARQIIEENNWQIEIQVDGNIGENTIPKCLKSGASMFVGGTSSVYKKGTALKENVKEFRGMVNN